MKKKQQKQAAIIMLVVSWPMVFIRCTATRQTMTEQVIIPASYQPIAFRSARGEKIN